MLLRQGIRRSARLPRSRCGALAREIGNAQGWRYPADRLIVHWETVLFDWCRVEDPLSDLLLNRIWSSFEEVLVEALPEAERIVTPSWEDEVRRRARCSIPF